MDNIIDISRLTEKIFLWKKREKLLKNPLTLFIVVAIVTCGILIINK